MGLFRVPDPIFISYYDVARETGSNIVPQKFSLSTIRYNTEPVSLATSKCGLITSERTNSCLVSFHVWLAERGVLAFQRGIVVLRENPIQIAYSKSFLEYNYENSLTLFST